MRRPHRMLSTLLGIGCLVGCGDPPAPPPQTELAVGTDRVGGDILSTVDGVGIAREDVIALMQSGGFTAREALTRLQEEVLLSREAERRGYHLGARGQRLLDRALVQTLLAELETTHAAEDVGVAQARQIFDSQDRAMASEEARRSRHVLVRVPTDVAPGSSEDADARALAVEILTELASAEPGDASVYERWAATERARSGADTWTVFADELPLLPRSAEGQLGTAFRDALFGVGSGPLVERNDGQGLGPGGLGVLPEPVRTEAGWHVILVDEIVPARRTFEEWQDEIRRQVADRNRVTELHQLIESLRTQVAVERNERAESIALHATFESDGEDGHDS